VPQEWNIRDACIRDARGDRVVDFARTNLHVVGYSAPVAARMTLAELRPHLFSLPDRPEVVPYRTAYYDDSWAFCVAHRELVDGFASADDDAQFDVEIDATLEPGHLTYGECLLEGERADEVLISCHVCHPSMANDNLSGIAVAAHLGSLLATMPRRRYSYRLLFIPGTIGSIVWLARNEATVARIRHGLVITGIGDAAPLMYKRSRRGDADIDRVVEHVLAARSHEPPRVVDFSPYGYDERQFCSPGFNLPVGRLGRSAHGEYPEYHTSADDLSFVRAEQLEDALDALLDVVGVLEGNERFRNLKPKGEPQLGRRGLYRALGGGLDRRSVEMALLWVLNYSDGEHDLLDIAARSGVPFRAVREAADALLAHDLLAVADA
jgi:aminopeptidase-like protein